MKELRLFIPLKNLGGMNMGSHSDNESDGRMYVAGLIPPLRPIDLCYLSFSQTLHAIDIVSPIGMKIQATDELGMADNIC